jgi:hypothetical protein
VFGSIAAHNHRLESRRTAHYNRVVKKQIAETNAMIALAADEIVEYRESNGEFPSDIEANVLVLKHVDPWNESLRFDMKADGGTIRSAGPDGTFDTRDDVTAELNGETGKTILLEVVKKKVTERDLMED